MTTKYFTCAETAKMVRQSLKEAFPGVKFSVKSSVYSGGASIGIRWTDGPNAAQVESISSGFKAAYFDGMIDYQGSISHMIDGQQVHFGADFITTNRQDSDAAVQKIIDRTVRRYSGNFRESGIVPTVDDFRNGRLYGVYVSPSFPDSLQSMIGQALAKQTDRLKINHSVTAAKKFVTHDDGYSRECGSGFSAVNVD